MSIEAAIIIENNNITDSFFNFLDNKKPNRNNYKSKLSLYQVKHFSKLAKFLKTHSKNNVKLEMIFFNNRFVIRVKKNAPFVNYKLFNTDTKFEKILKFVNRNTYTINQQTKIKEGKYNLIAGRFAEKLVHEWISHPLENNHTIPTCFNATTNGNAYQLSNIYYNGKYNEHIPNNWIYFRYISKGNYNHNTKKINIFVKEAFVKKNGLIQSTCPFSCSFDLEQLNNTFCKVVSNKNYYNAGFLCTKGEKTVFGTVNCGFVLFKNIKITPKGETNE
jgi:hypothetical protein